MVPTYVPDLRAGRIRVCHAAGVILANIRGTQRFGGGGDPESVAVRLLGLLLLHGEQIELAAGLLGAAR